MSVIVIYTKLIVYRDENPRYIIRSKIHSVNRTSNYETRKG